MKLSATIPLGELVDVISGFAFKSERFASEGELPLVRIRDVERGYSETYYSGEYDNLYIVKDGDLLIGMDGEFNRELWKGGAALLNQRVCKIVADERRLSSAYLYHFLPAALRQIEDRTPFATVKHLSAKEIRSISIPLPPLDEQRRIAAILDKADALRRKRKRALELLDTLTESMFLEMFQKTNFREMIPIRTIGEVCEVGSGSTPSRDESSNFGGSVCWVKTTEVKGQMIWNTQECVTPQGIASARLRLYPKGTVLIAMYGQGATRGKVGILGVDATVNQACAALLTHSSLDPIFLFHQLKHSYEALRSLGRGGNQPNLNGELVKSYPILVPPLDDQRRFVQLVRSVSEIAEHIRPSLQYFENLFASLQHRAFSGQL